MTTQQPPKKRRKLDLTEDYKVSVGSGNGLQIFTVHECFLTKSSDFLKAACKNVWQEGQTRTIRLPEQHPDLFSIYLQWLYTSELVVNDELPSGVVEPAAKDLLSYKDLEILIKLYQMADMLLDARMRNAVIDGVLRSAKASLCLPGRTNVRRVYESTQPGCALRRLMVDLYASHSTATSFRNNGDQYPAEFLADMVAMFVTARNSRRVMALPFSPEKCHYHDHDEANPKCA